MSDLSPRSEAILSEILDLRRQRKRIDERLRVLIAMDRPASVSASDALNPSPWHCLRCDYSWYSADPTRPPQCCSRCGTTKWMLPPEDGSRKPGDAPAASWRRRKASAEEIALRRERAEKKAAERAAEMAKWRGPAAPLPPLPALPTPWEHRITSLPPQPPTLSASSTAFPPPPDISIILPRPPEPAAVSLSARLQQFRAEDPSPEQPERTIAAPIPIPVIVEDVEVESEVMPNGAGTDSLCEPAGDHAEPASIATSVDAPPNIRDTVDTVGVPVSDAEREELARAKEEAWPTTRSED